MGTEKKETKCRIKAPSPEVCGYADWETVSKFAEDYPHLRPHAQSIIGTGFIKPHARNAQTKFRSEYGQHKQHE